MGGTFTIANGESAGNTFVIEMRPIGSGFLPTADEGQQTSVTLFLQSDTTLAQLNLLLTAANGGPSENCQVIGAGTLITS
jgi:hypothetical protein